MAAVMKESISDRPLLLEGCFIDLFDPALPVLDRVEVRPGSEAFLYDVRKAPKAPCILAASSRAYDEQRTRRSFSYLCKSPVETSNVTRIRLPKEPVSVLVDGIEATDCSWNASSRTLFLRFPNDPDGVAVEIRW
jgi:hypothetical protein